MLWLYMALPFVWLWELTASLRDRLDLVCVHVRIGQLVAEIDQLPSGPVRDKAIELKFAMYRHRLAIRRTITGRQVRWLPGEIAGADEITSSCGGYPRAR